MTSSQSGGSPAGSGDAEKKLGRGKSFVTTRYMGMIMIKKKNVS